MRFLVAAVSAFLGLAAVALAQGTNTYVNERFGTRIDYPAAFSPVEPGPENNDGRTFGDGSDARFLVYGRNNIDGKSIEQLQLEAVEFVLAGVKPSYQRATRSWFVISAVVGGSIIYHKELLGAGGDVIHTFHAEYPVVDKARYDEAVTLMANSLGSVSLR